MIVYFCIELLCSCFTKHCKIILLYGTWIILKWPFCYTHPLSFFQCFYCPCVTDFLHPDSTFLSLFCRCYLPEHLFKLSVGCRSWTCLHVNWFLLVSLAMDIRRHLMRVQCSVKTNFIIYWQLARVFFHDLFLCYQSFLFTN